MSTAFSVCCGSRYTGGHALATSQIDCERVPVIDTMSLEQLPDEELVKQFRLSTQAEAREQNVNELFRRNYARVARWCLRFADNRESAADLAQEVFAKAYQNLHSFQGQSKFTTWLFVIAKDHCLNSVRAQSLQASERAAEDGEDILLELPDGAPPPYAAAERGDHSSVPMDCHFCRPAIPLCPDWMARSLNDSGGQSIAGSPSKRCRSAHCSSLAASDPSVAARAGDSVVALEGFTVALIAPILVDLIAAYCDSRLRVVAHPGKRLG